MLEGGTTLTPEPPVLFPAPGVTLGLVGFKKMQLLNWNSESREGILLKLLRLPKLLIELRRTSKEYKVMRKISEC